MNMTFSSCGLRRIFNAEYIPPIEVLTESLVNAAAAKKLTNFSPAPPFHVVSLIPRFDCLTIIAPASHSLAL